MHKLSDTQSILMYYSVVKAKSHGLKFFKIKLQSIASAYIAMLPQSSDTKFVYKKLNKNIFGVKKVRG